MLGSLQTVVRRRFFPLLMAMVAAGFLLLLLELIGYNHFGGLQVVGTAAVGIGLVAALLGIGARGGLRTGLIAVFLLMSLVGLLGEWEHNEERLGGEEGERPAAAASGEAGTEAPGGEGDADGDRESGPGGAEEEIPPPLLAPLSVSGLALFGAVTLLARRDDDRIEGE